MIEFLSELKILIYIPLFAVGIILFTSLCAYMSEWLADFLYKIFTIILKPFKKLFKPLPPSLRKRCAELEAECAYLQKELQKRERKHKNDNYRNYKNTQFLKSEHNREIGQVVTSEFNDIILSFINAKPLAPNVSIEHLTRLCYIPEANDRFFRALLQDFVIETLKMVRDKNGKYNIAMKLKSGEKSYITTLTTCNCPDFRNRKGLKVCKHMYFLALTLGLISPEYYDEFRENALKTLPKEKIKSLKKK